MTLQERIEAFLDSSTTLLADLQAEDFERHRQALIAAKLQQCHSSLDESDRHWEQIQTRRCVLTAQSICILVALELRMLSFRLCRADLTVYGQPLDLPKVMLVQVQLYSPTARG